MSLVSIALIATLAVSLAIQSFLAIGWMIRLRRSELVLPVDRDCPFATVILCLRGGDPFLARCVQGLLKQDYPKYRVVCVVDHPDDPTLRILNEVLRTNRPANWHIEFLSAPLTTCSLKCSSIVQAYRLIDASHDEKQFIAQLDADTIPHSSWLRELAGGLAPSNVGAATGNRWYLPQEPTIGSLVRYAWNSAAIVQMMWYRIAWGGTLAVKVSAIREANLVERWQNALCEDTMLHTQLAKIGKRVAFVPSLMMINREDCTLSSFVPWVARQLLTARLYHPSWPVVVGHGIGSAALLIWGIAWFGTLVILGHYAESIAVLAAMVGFQLVLIANLNGLATSVEFVVMRRGEDTNWCRLGLAGQIRVAMVTQWIYTEALVRSLLLRRVNWRGINYRVDGPWRIKMLEYHPFVESHSETTKASESL